MHPECHVATLPNLCPKIGGLWPFGLGEITINCDFFEYAPKNESQMPMITLFKLCSSIVPIQVAILEVSLIFEEAHSRSAPWRRGYVNNATMKLSPQGTAVDYFFAK